MKTIFLAESGAALDISKQKISVLESNSKVSDQSFSKIMFPFEAIVDENFIEEFGDFVSYETTDLETKVLGNLEFEGKISTSKLDIMSIEGLNVTGQIYYGLEEVPNFEKKLSELPLEKFSVDDIHIFAKQICEKKYPETNFNFPRMFTPKYSPDDSLWDAFNGYYNDMNPAGTEMLRNYIDGAGEIFNQNVIHACPHLLYLLKMGFQDGGYGLAGDILTDPVLAQRWVFSGTEYFSKLTQLRNNISLTCNDYIRIETAGQMNGAEYEANLSLFKKGKYKVRGTVNLYWSRKVMKHVSFDLYLNDVKILNKTGKNDIETTFDITINTTEDNAVLRWEGRSAFKTGEFFNVLQLEAIGESLEVTNNPGEDVGVITNLNEIDLAKAVPEMTFGELVNRIKNWLNYDIEVKNKVIYMNKIVNSVVTEGKNFEFAEILRPKRRFLSGKSFLHKFSDLDNDVKLNSMFYDKDGALLNGKEKLDTNIIEVNGYAMPVSKEKETAPLTAKVMKDSTDTLALVWYDGLTAGQNNAKNPEGCNHPELFANNWEAWLRQRIRGQEYDWSFKVSIEKLSQFSVKDYIFCYNNLHIIKNWTKDKTGDDTYEVQIVTETVI
ncbi:hypothetical protein [Chryseobacterium sp. MP_3.2]|uniref:hypothetical protein n=1 Tax=Chryseobacterium sp. MP_3.2 TaxID=3071712 RepID=UPI002DFFFA49|nr:hypothetical protein [Chryseobacterium sp. MP_3.2]